MEDRLNYGVALASSGEYQIVDTTSSPGIKDDYSLTRYEAFTFLVAPHGWIDSRLGIKFLTGGYKSGRRSAIEDHLRIKNLILKFHGIDVSTKKPSWA